MSKRVLVIDDELDIQDVVCLSLEEFGGWQTDSASSGVEGLEKATAMAWDAILLDVSMPDMDGFAVHTSLQTHSKTRCIPVILLTAKLLTSDRNRFEQMGMAGVISKPFNPVTVWQQVAQILGWAV